MKLRLTILTSLVLLSGCAVEEPVMVYESRNALQCETSGISPTDSAEKLSTANIEVIETHCGQRTGVAYPAACGMGTGTILIHQIPQADLVAARQIGFQAVSELINLDEGTGYEFLECDEN
ncbi:MULTISPECIES: hypothetical protein [unclassified Methylophaga]|jgi:PBP1b-binding outer membrane lipoprotein LpoB|uniref:hypothetical protein n=1 Tax=unclassified Methylophaga TaxID=2629249 RepID=UPI000C95BE9D|nr:MULTISPECIES: hypothetical protein [unclassified Methylophaga]MAK67811.1 hypothetical protein [Methylophaga sp.]MAY18492.1 hypothetical protein [Methylophaga sp.]MBN45879.1 hypothetical protein [Methylophaga sp.]HAO26252.1 hypothetical protein [Methylophaga sp.]HCD04989.1 hypothetical protein [Methylophaga sp.]|tara:strand:- start:23750 stop:24112 length:363 start_codon:yes stop_codon:yes gene_type:complete